MAAQPTFDFPQRLSEKLQPKTLEDFIGLERPRAILREFIRHPRNDAWYFYGPSGTGKTTMAQAVIAAINAEEHHIPAKSCDLDTIRDVMAMCHRAPWLFHGPNAGHSAKWHVVHVSEADQMTGAAQLDLLSRMDSTAWPPTTIFIFTANGTSLLERRFLSRCKVLQFAAPNGNLAKYLAKIYKGEGGGDAATVDFEKIAEDCGHNVRDALGQVEMELMIPESERKSLRATVQNKPEADHTHKCGECAVTIECNEKDCRKAAVAKVCPLGGRPPCAGTTPARAEAARRGHETRKEKR